MLTCFILISQSLAPAPGGFNFGASANNTTTGGPGMFNFAGGSGTPTGNAMFTAGIGGDANVAGRKIKRAVRRNKPR